MTTHVREYPATWAVRETGPAEHLLEGLAVPYDTETQVSDTLGSYAEIIARGAVDPATLTGRPLMLRHTEPLPVGVITRAWDSERGLMVAARPSDTALGRDVVTLARDGALTGLSIGFDPTADGQWSPDNARVTWTAIAIREVSLTPFPAYTDARLTNVRERGPAMPEGTENDTEGRVATLVREQLDPAIGELREQVATLARENRRTDGGEYRTPGEFAADLWRARMGGAVIDTEALARHTRAIGSQVAANSTGVLPVSYLNHFMEQVYKGRPTINALGVRTLPDYGMTINVPQVTAEPATADQSAWLGATADGSMTVAFAAGTVFTEVGAAHVPRQFIDRASPDGLALLTERLGYAFAKRTNARAITLLGTASQTTTIATGAYSAANVGTMLADAAAQVVAGIGAPPTHVLVGPAIYFSIAMLASGSFPFAGGVAPGDAQLSTLSFRAFGIEWVCDPALTTTFFVLNKDAIEYYESPGAPFNLSAPVPSTVSNDVAVYGYGAFVTNTLAGIVKGTKTT